MSYCIMRLEKRKANNITCMQIHNDRSTENHSNKDINKELTHLNYDLIECESYKKKINEELEKRYTVNKSLRKDANLCVEVIFTSDKEFFDKLSSEQESLYFEKSLEFLQEFAGEENVISATVHKDENTPHLHAVFMPLTRDGRLNYKDFINTKYDLINLQDKYHEKMTEFFPELERGKSSTLTERKHLSVEEFKLKELKVSLEKIKEEQKDIENQIDNLNKHEKTFLSIKEIVENIEEKKTLLSSNTYKISSEELVTLSSLALSSEANKLENEKLKKEVKELRVKADKYDDLFNTYFSLKVKLKKSEKFREKFKDYSERLEAAVPKEDLKVIQEENISYMKIKEINTEQDFNNFLSDLWNKGSDCLNKVEQNFLFEKKEKSTIAKDLYIDSIKSEINKIEKSKKKTTEKSNQNDKENPWEKRLKTKSRDRGGMER